MYQLQTPPKPAPSTRPKPVSKPSKPTPTKTTPSDHSKETSSPITTATPTKPPPPMSSSTPSKVPPPAVVTKVTCVNEPSINIVSIHLLLYISIN